MRVCLIRRVTSPTIGYPLNLRSRGVDVFGSEISCSGMKRSRYILHHSSTTASNRHIPREEPDWSRRVEMGKLMSLSDSDSDDPVAIEPLSSTAPPHPARSRVAKPSTSPQRVNSSPYFATATSDDIIPLDTPPDPPTRRERSRKESAQQREVVDNDEIVFVRESTVNRLAAKFTYGDGATETSSSSGRTSTLKATSSLRIATTAKRSSRTAKSTPITPSTSTAPGTPLLPLTLFPEKDPLPVPDWLGKPAVLNALQGCVVCHVHFRRNISGPERWVGLSSPC